MIVRELFAKLGMQVDGSSFAKAQSALGGLHLALAGLRDIVKPIYDGLKDIAEGTANAAREALNASRITGLTTQQVQALGYAAKQSGIDSGELEHGLIHLARSAQEAAQGSAEANMAYARLGVRATDASGKVRPMGDLLNDVAAAIAKMPDGTAKAAASMALFGRAGAQLIPLLDKGPAGIALLSKEAKNLGVVMSDRAIAAGVRYQQTLDRMSAAVTGAKYAIANQLFPALGRSTEQLARWISINRQMIALRIRETFESISQVVQSFVRIGQDLVQLFQRVWNSGGAAKTVLVSLGVVAAAMLAPWASLATAIALVGQDIELFFSSHGKAKTYTGLLVEAFELLKKKLMSVWDEFSAGWKKFKDHPFQFLYDEATEFFAWFVKEAVKIPGKIADALKAGADAAGKVHGLSPNAGGFMGLGGDASKGDDYSWSAKNPLGQANPLNWFPKYLAWSSNNSAAQFQWLAGVLQSAQALFASAPSGPSVAFAGGGSPSSDNVDSSGVVTNFFTTINAPTGNAPDIEKAMQRAIEKHEDAKNTAAIKHHDKG